VHVTGHPLSRPSHMAATRVAFVKSVPQYPGVVSLWLVAPYIILCEVYIRKGALILIIHIPNISVCDTSIRAKSSWHLLKTLLYSLGLI
jgi:hypothetical protein